MKKLILMSILIATFAFPFFYSGRPLQPRKAVKLIEKRFLVFCVLYVLACCYVIPRMS